MPYEVINYGKLVDEAMHIIVAKVLKDVEMKGLPDHHHFFISFLTHFPGVVLSSNLKSRYPREMTIILQYQFQDLKVSDKGFSVILSFNGIKENIYIPFIAITTFADPSVQFGIQFNDAYYDDLEEVNIEVAPASANFATNKNSATETPPKNNVIALDNFRKKKL